MFPATFCSSSGGRIVLIQHPTWQSTFLPNPTLSFSTCTPDGHRQYYTRCCINTIWPLPDDVHRVARNM